MRLMHLLRGVIALSIVFAAFVAWMSVIQPVYACGTNCNYPGSDIKNIRGGTVDACRKACIRTKGCMAFTWVKPGIQDSVPICWLKYSIPKARPSNCCVSGMVLR